MYIFKQTPVEPTKNRGSELVIGKRGKESRKAKRKSFKRRWILSFRATKIAEGGGALPEVRDAQFRICNLEEMCAGEKRRTNWRISGGKEKTV